METLSRYRKAIGATLGALGTWVPLALADGHITSTEWSALATAIAGVFGVYQAVNTKAPSKPARRRR